MTPISKCVLDFLKLLLKSSFMFFFVKITNTNFGLHRAWREIKLFLILLQGFRINLSEINEVTIFFLILFEFGDYKNGHIAIEFIKAAGAYAKKPAEA